ncbi:hypothetical protein C4588_02800 [Candidatus Parcubacteria bacterium]|nr:MAG: hypothetical protein C4588_02800 [Candidatus Parcubacteria bacterium]
MSWLWPWPGAKPKNTLKVEPLPIEVPDGVVLPQKLPKTTCVLSVDPAKNNDQLITIFHPNAGKVKQYLRRRSPLDWFEYPSFDKARYWVEYEDLLETFQMRQEYAEETIEPLSFAIKARKSAIKCVYCHEAIAKIAQTCLQCGGFICLPCSTELKKGCLTPGCQQ